MAATADTSETVLYSVSEEIATLTFHRPERLNALTGEMSTRYLALLRRPGDDPAVRVVVVTGAGRGFCAGIDYTRLQELDVDEIRRHVVADPRDVAVRIDKPVIAAVAGAGLAHALLADVRFTVPEATWTTAFAKVGLSAEIGAAWTLTNLVGTGRALDLLLSARRFTGTEAHEYGLAQFVSEPESLMVDVRAYARTLAANDTSALAAIRQQVRLDAGRPFAEAWTDGYERVFGLLDQRRSDRA